MDSAEFTEEDGLLADKHFLVNPKCSKIINILTYRTSKNRKIFFFTRYNVYSTATLPS